VGYWAWGKVPGNPLKEFKVMKKRSGKRELWGRETSKGREDRGEAVPREYLHNRRGGPISFGHLENPPEGG